MCNDRTFAECMRRNIHAGGAHDKERLQGARTEDALVPVTLHDESWILALVEPYTTPPDCQEPNTRMTYNK